MSYDEFIRRVRAEAGCGAGCILEAGKSTDPLGHRAIHWYPEKPGEERNHTAVLWETEMAEVQPYQAYAFAYAVKKGHAAGK